MSAPKGRGEQGTGYDFEPHRTVSLAAGYPG